MKLKEYVYKLQKLARNYPDVEVYVAIPDYRDQPEYHPVNADPAMGRVRGCRFIADTGRKNSNPNAVALNPDP